MAAVLEKQQAQGDDIFGILDRLIRYASSSGLNVKQEHLIALHGKPDTTPQSPIRTKSAVLLSDKIPMALWRDDSRMHNA